MKKFGLFALLALTLAASLAPLSTAFADKHGDKFKRDCATGARKC